MAATKACASSSVLPPSDITISISVLSTSFGMLRALLRAIRHSPAMSERPMHSAWHRGATPGLPSQVKEAIARPDDFPHLTRPRSQSVLRVHLLVLIATPSGFEQPHGPIAVCGSGYCASGQVLRPFVLVKEVLRHISDE